MRPRARRRAAQQPSPVAAGGRLEAGVQGGVEQRRVEAEAPPPRRLLLGKRHLGVDLLAVAPGRGQALEGGAVVEADLGEALVEGLDLERLGARRRPLRRAARPRLGGLGAESALACRVHSLPPPPSGREWIETSRRPVLLGGADRDLQRTAPCSGRSSGACRVSSSTRSAPTSSPACSASSTKAVPGRSTVPPTAWSASQGWDCSEIRPVRMRPSPPGSSIVAAEQGVLGVALADRAAASAALPLEASQ